MPLVVTLKPDEAIALTNIMLDSVAKNISNALSLSIPKIKENVSDIIGDSLKNSLTYIDLVGGNLRYQLGINNPVDVIDSVISNIQTGVKVNSSGCRRVGNQLQGGMTVEIVKGDYSELLNANGASFTSEQGYKVDWLKWLTLNEGTILVTGYHFLSKKAGRTGGGVMVPKGNWSVPEGHYGDYSNNWITDAIIAHADRIVDIVISEIQRNLT